MRTIDSSHRVNEEYRKTEYRDELKLSGGSSIVGRARTSALTTTWLAIFARTNIDQDSVAGNFCLPVNKPLERIAAIEDSLELHLVLMSWSLGLI
jgi:hypothetical protein